MSGRQAWVGRLVATLLFLPPLLSGQQKYEELMLRYRELRLQGNLAEATKVSHEALRVGEETFGPQDVKVGVALANLGMLYLMQQKPAEAEPFYLRALPIFETFDERNPGRDFAAGVLDALGSISTQLRKHDAAESYYRRAIAAYEKRDDDRNPGLASTLGNLAQLYVSQGQHKKAEPLYERAAKIWERAAGPKDRATVDAREKLAEVRKAMKQPAAASTGSGFTIDAPASAVPASGIGASAGATIAAPGGAQRAHAVHVEALVITPDSKLLASASRDSTVKLWSLPEGRLVATLRGHTSKVYALAVSPNGDRLYSGGLDNAIRIWSLPDGRLLNTLSGHTGNVYQLIVTAGGETLVSAGMDKTVRLWSLADMKVKNTFTLDVSPHVTVSSNGKVMAAVGFGELKVWSLSDGTELLRYQIPEGGKEPAVLTPDGGLLAFHSSFTLQLLAVSERRVSAKLSTGKRQIRRLWASEDGSMLVVGYEDGQVEMRALPSGDVQKTLGAGGWVEALAVGSGVKVLAAGTLGGAVRLWSLPDGLPQATLQGPSSSSGRIGLVFKMDRPGHLEIDNGVTLLAASPDGKTLASAAPDGRIVLWNMEPPGFRTFLIDPAAN